MNLIENILNFKVLPEWNFDQKRAYRQVNGFCFTLIILMLLLSPFLGIIAHSGIKYFLLIASVFYSISFIFIAKHKINVVKKYVIIVFEIQLFFGALLISNSDNLQQFPYFSPAFIGFILFPLLAALFDLSIKLHVVIAFAEILLVQVVLGVIDPEILPGFHSDAVNLLNLTGSMFTITVAGILIHLLHVENMIVKNREIERSKQLEGVLDSLKITIDKIKEQKKELETLNATKDRFFSIIAHDLKNPFNAILGFANFMRSDEIDNQSKMMMAKVLYQSAESAYNLLNNLLDWARSQMDKIEFKPESLKLNSNVNDSIQIYRLNAIKKNIVIENKISEDIHIYADVNLLNTIIRNLISNAIKFTNHNGTISVNAIKKENYLLISIKDNGVGMSKEQLQNLFRIDKKDSRLGTSKEIGTGLGLLLCKDFVDKHNGRIWVKSELYKGTIFYLTFPLASTSQISA